MMYRQEYCRYNIIMNIVTMITGDVMVKEDYIIQ